MPFFRARYSSRSSQHASHRSQAQIHFGSRDREIGDLLEQRERASAQTPEQIEIDAQLKRDIRILWQTRMLRDTRIQVTDEIENNLAIFARTFLSQIPAVKRRLARLFQLEGDVLPFLKPGSWVSVATATATRTSRRKRWTMPCVTRRNWRWIIICAKSTPWGRNCRWRNPWLAPAKIWKKLAASATDVSVHQTDEPYRRALTACYARMAATRMALLGHGPSRAPRYKAESYAMPPEAFAADLAIIAASAEGKW